MNVTNLLEQFMSRDRYDDDKALVLNKDEAVDLLMNIPTIDEKAYNVFAKLASYYGYEQAQGFMLMKKLGTGEWTQFTIGKVNAYVTVCVKNKHGDFITSKVEVFYTGKHMTASDCMYGMEYLAGELIRDIE